MARRSMSYHPLVMQDADLPLFEIRMLANRSLSARGMRLLILLLTGASLLIGTLFWCLGAWPVPGFCGAEILVACLLLRRNARGGRASEVIILRPHVLLLSRTDRAGRTDEIRLFPFWLKVAVLDRPGTVLRVRLVGHGISEDVGGLLGEDARRKLARSLEAALEMCKNPRYNNPQLQH